MARFLVAAVPLAALLTVGGGLAAQAQKASEPAVARDREDLTKSQFSKPPEPAPKEFRDMMRASYAIIGLDAPPENPTGGGAPAGPLFQGELAQHFTPQKEDYDAIIKNARTLKATFAKVEAFFAERKSVDGVELARSGQKALDEMEAGAAAKNRVAALRAAITVATTCRNCHLSHRVFVISVPMTFGIVG